MASWHETKKLDERDDSGGPDRRDLPPLQFAERRKQRKRLLGAAAIAASAVALIYVGARSGEPSTSEQSDEPDKALSVVDHRHARYGGSFTPDLSSESDEYKRGLERAQDVVEP